MYFDANARHLKKGRKFFVVGTCTKGALFDAGMRSGMYVLCEMLDDSNDKPSIKVWVGDKEVIVSSQGEYDEGFVTYEGTVEGTDFICDKAKAACLKIVGDFNVYCSVRLCKLSYFLTLTQIGGEVSNVK